MHLIQRMKIWKQLRRLEQRAKEQPSPSTFVDLGQVYINLDLHDKAERMADDGLALFPKSIELRQLLDCARRGLRHRRAG
ncbi:MAG TPA: tetratricopeptide repeat protein, partial [Planctomycetes bacterium]|nr:tetratricopeptide repeat protein [Planctomycetota bacterium]